MTNNLLKNAGFEADWGDEKSHWCLIAPVDAAPYDKKVGNIFTPSGWTTWFRHQAGTWDQPEVQDAWRQVDIHRVHSGRKGTKLFTFFRAHDAGFMQKVQVAPGSQVRLSAWAHAWSNTRIEGHEDCYEDARCSCGVGEGAAFALEDDAVVMSGDPWEDAAQNFAFYVGIDPTGATDPTADTVVWGQGAHIYNVYAQVPPVEAVAHGNEVTVYLRSRARWAFKHNDAYWDDVELIVVEPGPVVMEPEVHPTSTLPPALNVTMCTSGSANGKVSQVHAYQSPSRPATTSPISNIAPDGWEIVSETPVSDVNERATSVALSPTLRLAGR